MYLQTKTLLKHIILLILILCILDVKSRQKDDEFYFKTLNEFIIKSEQAGVAGGNGNEPEGPPPTEMQLPPNMGFPGARGQPGFPGEPGRRGFPGKIKYYKILQKSLPSFIMSCI